MACPSESELLDFGRGLLGPAPAQAIEQHLDGCPDCRALVAESLRHDDCPTADGLAKEPAAPADAYSRLGRYLVLELISAGGMGVVYAAFDPELERKVALKVLRPEALGAETATEAQGRLLREAQAMARLSHPNVAAVFDVGTMGEQVFLAMELVDGGTLADWLAEARRDWAEVVEVFLEAGRGLAAAHAAGLVHRDFKPSNVLIGKDGRVRVTDFGLARPAITEPAAEAVPNKEPGQSVTAGTPAYMAPEQFRGGQVDARSDQYSFCVALWEGLYGERPCGGKTLREHAVEVLAGRLRPPPTSQARVPAWLHRVLLRGLSTEPEARFAFIEGLLDELGRSRRAERRLRWGLGAAAALALAGIVGVLQLGQATAGRCLAAGREIDALWSAARQEQARKAFELAGAAASFPRTDAAIRAAIQSWRAAARRLCATPDSEAAAAQLAGRKRCLDERRFDLEALAEGLATVDALGAARSAEALAEQGPPESCLAVVLDADRRWASHHELVARRIARAEALRGLGKQEPARQEAQAALEAARTAGLKRLEARAALAHAYALPPATAAEQIRQELEAAATLAETARESGIAAQAWAGLAAFAEGPPEARRAAAHARAFIEASGGDPALEASVAVYLARALVGTSGEEARQAAAHAVELAERGPWLLAQAEALATRARVADSPDAAVADVQRAERAIEQALGPADVRVAIFLMELARTLKESGRLAEARQILERARPAAVAARGPRSAEVLSVLTELGQLELAAGDPSAAARYASEAKDLAEALLGPDTFVLGPILVTLAEAERGQERCQEAMPTFERALALCRDDATRSTAWLGLAGCQATQGQRKEAVKSLERGLTEVSASSAPLLQVALGQALWEAGEKRRGRSLVEKATEGLIVPARDDALSWLASHQGP